jgi:ADP-ribosyl-[dinitrogen reductase] hydrolase
MDNNLIKSALFGLAVGDALGVPVEFESREYLKRNPVTDMIGYGTYNQPPGTWSDDSSLAFCLAEALATGFSLQAVAENFVKWLYQAWWTPHGEVFDVGQATRTAISKLWDGVKPELAGGNDEYSNGNGSLMRILPLLFYLKDKPVEESYGLTRQVSSITHAHIRSVIACFYYLEFARHLLTSKDKFSIYDQLQTEVSDFLISRKIEEPEIRHFDRLLKSDISKLDEDAISSSGYVVHTLEASIWCLLTTGSYEEAVLKAVNLGEDTDTTGAVTGGLAGLLYGYVSIPERWLVQLARKADIEGLAERMLQNQKSI